MSQLMKYCRRLGLLSLVFLNGAVLSVGAPSSGTAINFSSLDKSQTYQLSGTLYLAGKHAQVHARQSYWFMGLRGSTRSADFIANRCWAPASPVFEVDFKTGIFTGPMDRPHIDTFLPMAFAA